MNAHKVIIIIFINISLSLNAQYGSRDYYYFSDSILHQFAKDSNTQSAAFLYSFIGEYRKALEFWDKTESDKLILNEIDKKKLLNYVPTNAKKYIINQAKKERIVVINEAHHQPYHRFFTTQLLNDLYGIGYKYLFLEALTNPGDTFLNSRKYPLINSGILTSDPIFGKLVREALKIGFKVLPYEAINNFKIDSLGINHREIEQARNISKIFDLDSAAKILVHCGFDHAIKSELKGWGKAMAGRLYEYSGIEPFTIDQVTLSEHSSKNQLLLTDLQVNDFENPIYKEINLNYSAVFLDSNGKALSRNNGYNAVVYHPRTNYINGRQNWLFDEDRKPYFVKKMNVSYPCLIFAYLADERLSLQNSFNNPVPFDIIEIKNEYDLKPLSLAKGKYLIIIKDQKNKEERVNVEID